MLLVYLQPIFPCALQPPEGDQYYSLLPCIVIHGVYFNAISHLWICDESLLWVFPSLRSRFTYEWFGAGTSCSWQLDFTILTPLSLLSWCRLSFPIMGLKIFFVYARDEIFAWIVHFALCWIMLRHVMSFWRAYVIPQDRQMTQSSRGRCNRLVSYQEWSSFDWIVSLLQHLQGLVASLRLAVLRRRLRVLGVLVCISQA